MVGLGGRAEPHKSFAFIVQSVPMRWTCISEFVLAQDHRATASGTLEFSLVLILTPREHAQALRSKCKDGLANRNKPEGRKRQAMDLTIWREP